MSKEQSQILKGIAILMMIFLPLFNRMSNVELCSCLFYIHDVPLVFFLSKFVNPVPIFLILSGYGLYKSWLKGDKNRWGRILKLLIHFWVILLVFVSIGHFVKPYDYPGSISKLFLNITTFDTSYNSELWFLSPFLCVSITSPFFFRFAKKLIGIG